MPSPCRDEDWRRRLATKTGDKVTALPNKGRSLSVPLTVVSSPVIEVELPCGAVVRVPNDEPSLD